MSSLWRLAALLLCLNSLPALAGPLDVPAAKAWQHARTGMILRPQIGGLARESLKDASADEVDIIAGYMDAATGTIGTIFLFHPGVVSTPIWFDRAQAALLAQKVYGTPQPASATAFALKPGAASDSLRVVYALQGGNMRSTALAAVPIGDWLAVVRLSSGQLDAPALDARLNAFLGGIGWPPTRSPASAATPIIACSTPLTYKKARLLQADMGQALIDAMLPQVAAKKEQTEPEPVTYCRDRQAPDAEWAIYQPNGVPNTYVMALGDGGSSITIAPTLVLKGGPAYSVTLYGLDRRSTYANVSALPPPEQAYEIVTRTPALTSISTLDGDGKTNITINSDALRRTR